MLISQDELKGGQGLIPVIRMVCLQMSGCIFYHRHYWHSSERSEFYDGIIRILFYPPPRCQFPYLRFLTKHKTLQVEHASVVVLIEEFPFTVTSAEHCGLLLSWENLKHPEICSFFQLLRVIYSLAELLNFWNHEQSFGCCMYAY